MIEILVLGEPVTQLRPIFNSYTKTAVDPKKSRDYKKKVRETAVNFIGDKWEPLNEPLKVEVVFYRGIPKSFSKKRVEMAHDGKIFPVTTPDTDNYLKCILDGVTGTVWKDDNCIVELVGKKMYSKVPRAEMTIYTLDEDGNWI